MYGVARAAAVSRTAVPPRGINYAGGSQERRQYTVRTTFPRNIHSPEVYKLDLGFSSSSAQLTTFSSRASLSKIMSNVQEPPTAPVEQEAPAVSNTPGATNVAPVFESLDADEVR